MGLLLVEGALVLTWKEPVTSYLQSRAQGSLAGELRDDLSRAEARRVISGAPAGAGTAAITADALAHSAALGTGDAVGRLEIPAIGVSQAVIEGTDDARLRRGPGHYPETSLPGLGAVTAIAGHRTTWGAPFRRLDDLRVGDPITARMPYGVSTYEVVGLRVVDDRDFSILEEVGRDRLVLTACHPVYSDAERLVVYAELRGAPRPSAPTLQGRPL